MGQIALDVAFKSDVATVKDATLVNPIAMAFGYCMRSDTTKSWAEVGEKTDEGVVLTDTVFFSFFDLASLPWKITEINIVFTNKGTGSDLPPSPFGWDKGTLTINGTGLMSPQGGVGSMGCNLTGSFSSYGPYTPTDTGNFEFTVTLTAEQVDSKGNPVIGPNGKPVTRIFQVDPEMDVEGT